MLGIVAGFFLITAGAVLASCVVKFWNGIKDWLNNVAADVVQEYIGYDARQALQRAVCKADRVVGKIRTQPTVYYRPSLAATHYDKVVLEVEASTKEYSDDFLKEINSKGTLIQEMGYKA